MTPPYHSNPTLKVAVRACDRLSNMPRPRVLPPTSELKKMVDAGWTQEQIAEHVFKTTGERVSRSAVGVALHRAGLTSVGPRYKRELPWRVKQEHLTDYPARMLRLLGRRRAGTELTGEDEKRLDGWLQMLVDRDAVVAYSPSKGFLYVQADEVNDGADGVPIRRRTITDDELQ